MLRFLYLHGFASGPASKKGVAFAERFAEWGVPVDRLDLRVPSFEHLRLSAMIDTVRAAIGGPRDRAVVLGSSLGGLTAARLAEQEARVCGLVLLAPAFDVVGRWREQLGAEWEVWRQTGWREVDDYSTGGRSRIDYGFIEDLLATDVGTPDVRVPTLILHGIHDDTVPIEHSRRFAAGRPHVELIELDDGHELTASIPRLIDEAARFLSVYGLRPRSPH